MIIDGYTLVQTCKESPEQYIVYKDGEQVAYIRLRHGCLRVDAPICGAKEIFYTEACKGDGRFDEERAMVMQSLEVAFFAAKKANKRKQGGTPNNK